MSRYTLAVFALLALEQDNECIIFFFLGILTKWRAKRYLKCSLICLGVQQSAGNGAQSTLCVIVDTAYGVVLDNRLLCYQISDTEYHPPQS